MARIGELLFDPGDTASIAQALTELQRVVDRLIEFGNPNDPKGSDTLAGGGSPTTHNGELMNIRGSWVELRFEALDTALTANHNLNIPVYNSEVNVRWIVMGKRHDDVGAGGSGRESADVRFIDTDSFDENTIELRAFAAGGLTVDATNPLRVSLFFIPAVRWPDT